MNLTTEADVRYELARREFKYFLPFVKIMDPPPGKGIISMEVWPHIEQTVQDLKDHRLIIWLKARQIGASWLMAAYDLWTALYHDGANVLLFSQGEPEAQQKLDKCRFIYNQLPVPLRPTLTTDNRSEMVFAGTGSKITALPSTPKAGRSSTGTLVDFDEGDFHEYLDTNYNAVKPILDDSGGQLVLVSTSNAYLQDTLFKRLYRGAPGNGWHTIFYDWRARPHRDDDWYERRAVEYDDPFQFSKEYPESDVMALAPPSDLMAFDLESLDIMKGDCRSPVEVQGNVRIFQRFSPGRKYAAATDTSHGVGLDAAVTVVLDVATNAVVADIMSQTMPPEQLAYESYNMLEGYGFPIWAIEDNDWGILTIRKAEALLYPNLYKRDSNHVGWRTTIKTRPMLWGELVEMTNSRALVVFAEDGLKHFYNVARDPKTGKIVSMKHDDYPMAVGLALQMREFAVSSTAPAKKAMPWDQKRRYAYYKW